MKPNTAIALRHMSPNRHRIMMAAGQFTGILILVLISSFAFIGEGGFPWGALITIAILAGPICAYLGFLIGASTHMCQSCNATGYYQDLKPLGVCPLCRHDKFHVLPWSERPYVWRRKNYRPTLRIARLESGTEVLEKAKRNAVKGWSIT